MTASPLLFALVAAVPALIAWLSARCWYRRQVVARSNRLRKCERRLQEVMQQAEQARRVVEKLQRDLSEARRAATSGAAATAAARSRASAVPARAKPVLLDDPASVPAQPPKGFADTMPM